jgi:hypothetical protein
MGIDRNRRNDIFTDGRKIMDELKMMQQPWDDLRFETINTSVGKMPGRSTTMGIPARAAILPPQCGR